MIGRILVVLLALIVVVCLGLGLSLISGMGLLAGEDPGLRTVEQTSQEAAPDGELAVDRALLRSRDPFDGEAEIVFGSLGGTVVDLKGRPLKAATVRLWPMSAEIVDGDPAELAPEDASAEVETDSAGAFLFVEIRAGTCWVRAEHNRHTMLPAAGHPASTGQLDLVIVMQTEASVSGRVITAEGQPVEGATAFVSLGASGLGRQQTTPSDEDGSFRIDAIAAGLYMLGAVHPNYGSFREIRRFAVGEDLLGVQLVLAPGMAIEGVVRNQFDELVVGARIEITQTRPDYSLAQLQLPILTTTEEGTFLLRGLDEATYDIEYSHADHLPAEPVLTRAGEHDQQLELRLLLAGGITGKVVDLVGQPIYQVEVSLATAEGVTLEVTKTDGDGFYEFRRLESGVYSVQAKHTEYLASEWIESSVELGEVSAPPNIVLRQGGEIAGRVLGRQRLGVVGATVWAVGVPPGVVARAGRPTLAELTPFAEGEVIEARSGAGGRFLVKGLRPDLYYGFGVTHARYLPLIDDSGLYPIGTEGLELHLESGTMLYGTVTSGDGGPVSGARIHVDMATDDGEPLPRSTYSDARGRYRMLALPPGQGGVTASAGGFRPLMPPMSLVIGGGQERAPLDLVLTPDPDGKIAGRVVTGGNLDPVLGALVAALPRWPQDQATFNSSHTRSDDEGLFTLEGLGEIPYLVGAEAKDYVRSGDPIEARPGQYLILHLMRIGTFSGRVVDERGMPIDEFEVAVTEITKFQDSQGVFAVPLGEELIRESFPVRIGVRAEGFAVGIRVVYSWNSFLDNPLGIFQLEPLLTLTGRVTGPMGEPVLGAVVELSDERPRSSVSGEESLFDDGLPLRGTTDDSGSFTLEFPAVDRYQIQVTHPEFEPYSRETLCVKRPRDQELEIELEYVPSISGVVRYTSGHPMDGVRVTVGPLDGLPTRERLVRLSLNTLTAVDGTFLLAPLERGRFKVRVLDPRDHFLLFERDVTLGENERVTLQF